MATSYHRVIQFESSFLKKLLFSILVTVWRFMFCLYLSTVESKKSLNGCLRQVESQFQRFVRTVSRRQVDFCCGLLFFSEVSGPLIVNLLLRLKWYSQKFVKGQWDKEDCVAELNNYIDRLSILSLANTNRKLPDILGELTAIRSTINDRTHSSQHVILTLHIDRDVYECVSLFDGLAYVFYDKLKSYGSEPKVVLVTGNRLYFSNTMGDYGIVEATAPNFKLQILRNPTYRSYVSSEKQGRSKRGEMHMNSQEDART
ncbi:PREDICTED: uncharacterized protein LOC106319019 isoform X1 [Brassica oleracea var. oleracea]|uniref:uncharacterized protein LOC106319019 isoform X1 n=1 Tax=Brassica oleracea var. oleracea TaxID=109376 RepID=UPI0006A6FD03|nr:PREDICTED: uncharacterized protein LOC106319019 isoform X1 [Brassica oleracea var. oleracea]XP_013612684.1 PREDICTED: uncharacterized protein LOC106319019 isoform X1 [Brassica oleracea var. oleracea]